MSRQTNRTTQNLFSNLPATLPEEFAETLHRHDHIRVERIVSHGHCSEPNFWYDQDEHEWVVVLQGAGKIEFEDGQIVELKTGDALNIAAHEKHRVMGTAPEELTIWLAVFYT